MQPAVGTGEGWPLPPVHQQTLGLTTVTLGLSRAQQSAAGNRGGVRAMRLCMPIGKLRAALYLTFAEGAGEKGRLCR